MKKSISLLVLILLLFATFLIACTSTPAPPPVDTDPITEAPTGAPTETPTGSSTEAPTEEETTPPETELYENSGFAPAEPITGSAPLSKPYAEKITVSNGTTELTSAGVTMQFQSQFYGHDSAIDRDHSMYGRSFMLTVMDKSLYKGDFFVGEYTGDHYEDMVVYADGVLTIYPTVVDTKNTFEYNGKIFRS